MRDLNEIQINEGGKPVSRKAPAPEDIAELERSAGFKLPPEYLALLQHSNGGHPLLDTFNAEGRGSFAIASFYHIDRSTRSNPQSAFYALASWLPVLGKMRLPIASDGGGNQLVLDGSKGRVEVLFYLHDSGELSPVAACFSDFIDMLDSNPDHI